MIPIHTPIHDGAADQLITLLIEPLPQTTTAADDLPPTPKVHLLPNTPAAQDYISQTSSSLFFWLKQQQTTSRPRTDGNKGDGDVITVIRGYGLESGVRPGNQAGGVVPVVPAWQVVLPGQVLGIAAKDSAEPVHSYVKVCARNWQDASLSYNSCRSYTVHVCINITCHNAWHPANPSCNYTTLLQVLGDRSLKYNYLNPNLVFIATGTPPGSDSTPDEASVSVAVINTVTGAVLHQLVHSGCAGPVYAVMSENWVVYSMRDVVNLRQQVRLACRYLCLACLAHITACFLTLNCSRQLQTYFVSWVSILTVDAYKPQHPACHHMSLCFGW